MVVSTENENLALLPRSVSQLQTFEDVLEAVGPLGKWQYWMCFCFGCAQFCTAMLNLGVVYFQITPDFACDVGLNTDWTVDQMKYISSPQSGNQDACVYYDMNYSRFDGMSFEEASGMAQRNSSLAETKKCEEFIYNRTANMRETIVTQYDLVCSRKYLTEHTQMVFMIGYLLGSFLAGILGDRYGRRPVFCIGAFGQCVIGISQSFSPNYTLFLFFRFLYPFTGMFSTLPAFCLLMETTTAKYRSYVGGLCFIPFALGYTMLSILAYFARDWRTVYFFASAPMAFGLTFWWIAMAMNYFGIALNVSSFAGDVFLNNFLAGLAEIPGYAVCAPLLAWGRKRSIISTLLIASVCLLTVPWIPEESLNGVRTAVAMLGKLLTTTGYMLVYAMTPELYPTVIRTSGISISCGVSRIGSAIAPYISTGISKDPRLDWLPMTIFGAFSLCATLLTLCLPETRGRKLPDQLEEAERFGVECTSSHEEIQLPHIGENSINQ